MEFMEFLTELHNPPKTNPLYYTMLNDNAKLIVYQTALTSKHQVAIQLNMSPQKFSTIFPLLKALAKAEDANNER